MAWNGVITNAGKTLLDNYSTNIEDVETSGLVLTRVLTGTGTISTENMRAATALNAYKTTGTFGRKRDVTNGVQVIAKVGPHTSSYVLKEVGVYAKLAGDNSDVLFALFENDDIGVQIPKADDFPDFVFNLPFVISTSNSATLTVTVSSAANVSNEELEEAVEDLEDALGDLEIELRTDLAPKTDIINDLTTGGTAKMLSAEQGKYLELHKLDLPLAYMSQNGPGETQQYIVIRMKTQAGSANNFMMSFVLSEYSGYTARRYLISGYSYDVRYWHQFKVENIAANDYTTERSFWYGYYGENDVWIAFLENVYESFAIDDITIGYHSGRNPNDYAKNMTISRQSALPSDQTGEGYGELQGRFIVYPCGFGGNQPTAGRFVVADNGYGRLKTAGTLATKNVTFTKETTFSSGLNLFVATVTLSDLGVSGATMVLNVGTTNRSVHLSYAQSSFSQSSAIYLSMIMNSNNSTKDVSVQFLVI